MFNLFYFIDTEKNIKHQQKMINKTLGLEILGSDIITPDDIMFQPTPSNPTLKVSVYIFLVKNIYICTHFIILKLLLCILKLKKR